MNDLSTVMFIISAGNALNDLTAKYNQRNGLEMPAKPDATSMISFILNPVTSLQTYY